MKQLDFYQMFDTLACAMWIGASGSIMIFGLYSRFGTTWGAWAALSTSVGMSGHYIFTTRNWADIVYPAIVKMGWVDSFDRALQVLSSPFAPYIKWSRGSAPLTISHFSLSFARLWRVMIDV